MRNRRKPWFWALSFPILIVLLLALVPPARTYLLRSAGWLIVDNQPPAKSADVIVVALDADGAGTLEAADLVHRGVSAQVAVFDDPPSPVDREFLRRGLRIKIGRQSLPSSSCH
jgi:hypothetical protein